MTKKILKTKIIILALLILLIISLVVCQMNLQTVYAEEAEDIYDNIFYQSAANFLDIKDESVSIDIQRKKIYDIDLKELGYIYIFDYNGQQGYAIIINDNNEIKNTEFVLDAQNPYYENSGINVYVLELTYAVYKDDNYYVSGYDESFNKEELESAYPDRYCGIGDSLENKSYTINYKNKEVNQYSMATTIPSYYYENIPNACAPISAANVIAFYDRYKTNLIKDYTPGKGLGSLYKYNSQNENIDKLINQLCIDMGTNSTGTGNTIDEFKEGMKIYCERQGYSVSFASYMSGNNFNYNSALEKLKNNIPIIMFLRKVELSIITENSNSDSYSCRYGDINHTLSVFGYKEIDYTLQDNTQRKEDFLLVASGIKNIPRAYLNMNNNLIVDDAYAISIN